MNVSGKEYYWLKKPADIRDDQSSILLTQQIRKTLSFKTVVDMLKQGIPVAEIAKENGISRPTIYKIKKANDL